jgi:uncharacterized tellurite resistance protein B-like protein
MQSENLIVSLAKVLIATAWADGELNNEEVNIMKDLLYQLPSGATSSNTFYTAREWSEIEMYLDSPVPPEERARLIDELQAELQTDQDKQMVLNALDELVRADGSISIEDEAVIDEIRLSMNDVNFSFFGKLSGLLSGPRQRRGQAMADAPNREKYLDEFINNKVYYGVRRRLDLGEGVNIDIDDVRLRRLSAVGGLLARVAQVDLDVTDDEFDKIVEMLQKYWELTQTEAVFVAEVAVSEVSPNMDSVRLAREIHSAVQPEQVPAFFDLLFGVASADGIVSNDEMDVIYEISRSLGQSHKTFIDAKMKIPADQRES